MPTTEYDLDCYLHNRLSNFSTEELEGLASLIHWGLEGDRTLAYELEQEITEELRAREGTAI
ncbi:MULTISPECIES: hypothetical protein [Streptomyces]|uniref:hypothetical protein n=1 Tax=Streptomyces TaxID=1883 RepID=UPI001E645440|nr:MULTISPECIES: hypothetical protein [Streptomyces]UFQ20514.1 hypothetical protein J2N69_16005 [Streptomyces huasconensis]WCL90119.1 hypothetical protein PPN52_16015 [Streptomyces sp. JCM 35825]